jgi:hypothetical protein
MPGGIHRQRDRRNHKGYRRPCGRFGERTGCPARTEGRLTALSSESSGNVAALTALQQNHNDNEEANQDVDDGNQIDHKFKFFPGGRLQTASADFLSSVRMRGEQSSGQKILVRKGGFEPPRLSAPPPQDGVSASSTTSALCELLVINSLESSSSEGIFNCTGFCTDFVHAMRSSGRCKSASRSNNLWTAASRAGVHSASSS